MRKIGIFFGTDTGSTSIVAKKIFSQLGEEFADPPKNINRAAPDELLRYQALILGTPSYGVGDLPGLSVGCQQNSWEEFVPRLNGADLSGKRVALFGLGNQEKYQTRFASSLIQLYKLFYGYGADVVGRWSTDGYQFQYSHAVIDNHFVGLVLDQRTQPTLTDRRIKLWLEQIKPQLLPDYCQAA